MRDLFVAPQKAQKTIYIYHNIISHYIVTSHIALDHLIISKKLFSFNHNHIHIFKNAFPLNKIPHHVHGSIKFGKILHVTKN